MVSAAGMDVQNLKTGCNINYLYRYLLLVCDFLIIGTDECVCTLNIIMYLYLLFNYMKKFILDPS